MTSDLRTICVSHTPVFGHPDGAVPSQEPAVREAYAAMAKDVAAFDPELVVLFAPDHFVGFDYRAMPPFCVGFKGAGAGDFRGPTGTASVDTEAAAACVEALAADGFDPAVSYRMQLDHGYTQPLTLLFGGLDRRPLLPIFINCAAPPLPSFRRAHAFGAAVGRWAAGLDKRVLFMGSGGLSHDPPVPSIVGAPPQVFDYLVNAGATPLEARGAREGRVLDAVRQFASGESDLLALNPDWDRWVLDRLTSGSLEDLAALSDAEVFEKGGRGGQEVRTWLAAFSALKAGGAYKVKPFFYDPIPEWLAGMGMVAARSVAA